MVESSELLCLICNRWPRTTHLACEACSQEAARLATTAEVVTVERTDDGTCEHLLACGYCAGGPNERPCLDEAYLVTIRKAGVIVFSGWRCKEHCPDTAWAVWEALDEMGSRATRVRVEVE